MCGIAGVRRFGKTPITGEELILLLCSIEHRGQHATGVALENPDGIRVFKAATPAWLFTKSKAFEEFLEANLTEETTTALLHTRFATTGNPENNENNHPIWDSETAIIHNGMITNHHHLFSAGNYKRSCETDSDIIRAMVSEHGMTEKGVRELNKMAGSAAIACISTKYPGKLLLARSGSPLTFGFTGNGDKLYWASEAHAINKACRPFKHVRGAWVQDTKADVSLGSMPDDTAWVFGPDEMEFHHEFRTCTYYRQPDYSKGRESYHTKTRNWKREIKRQTRAESCGTGCATSHGHRGGYTPFALTHPPKAESNLLKGAVVRCPGCGNGVKNTEGKPWKDLECPQCKAGMGAGAD